MQVNMYEPDPAIRALIGLPEQKAKVKNQFYDATELEKNGKHLEAQKIYEELLNNDFENCCIQAALGMNYAVQGKNGVAHLLLYKALSGVDNIVEDFKRVGIVAKTEDPKALKDFLAVKKSEIMNALGTCWKHENKTDKARYWFERAQKDIPSNPDIQNNLATLYINEGKPEKALTYLDEALRLNPEHAQARWNRALSLLELGDYENGFKEYGWGKRAEVRMDRNYTKHQLPEWDGSPDKCVVVYGEQGIGDEIMFASMIPDMMQDCKQVVFDCHKRLHGLFCNSFPTIDVYPTREDETITWSIRQDGTQRYPFDAKIAIGDIGKFYRRKIEDFPGTPYISPTTKSMDVARGKLANLPKKPNIGIAWIGGHKKTRIEVRSVSLEQMLPILKQDANWISLQYTDCKEEIDLFQQKHGIQLHYWPEITHAENYDATAGLVANLDLVICICTSVVHLAGSMGIPTWVLTPSRPAWRYRLDLDYMPWYGQTVTLFRQNQGTVAWEPVIEEVADQLAGLLSGIQK